jgi:hypothetical protein
MGFQDKIVESVKNARISLTVDEYRMLRYLITSETIPCVMEARFADPLEGPGLVEEADDNDDPNVEFLAARVLERPSHEGTRLVRGRRKRECLWKRPWAWRLMSHTA